MKNIVVFFAFIIVTFSAFSQDYRKIDWKTNVINLQSISVDTFKFEAEPIDFNDNGAISREIGNYFIDYIARCFKIIDHDESTITVVDLEHINLAPQSNRIGRVYQSILEADTTFASIGGVDISVIDELSRWKDVARNNEIFGRVISRITSGGGVVVETDPVFSTDSADLIHWDDTLSSSGAGIPSRHDVALKQPLGNYVTSVTISAGNPKVLLTRTMSNNGEPVIDFIPNATTAAAGMESAEDQILIQDWAKSLAKTIDIVDTTWWGRAETDPNVSAWAKAPTKPTYTASEVGALASGGTAANSSLLENHAASYFQTALKNPVTGTGIAAYITKFISNGVIGNSLISEYYDNVGIGNPYATYKLDVTGNINTSTMYRVGGMQVYTAPLTRDSAGTSGQILTSTGASSAPTWQNSGVKTGSTSLVAGWNWVTIPTQDNVNYNPNCITYNTNSDVGNKIEYSTMEVSRFQVWVYAACTCKWTILK